MPNQTAMKIVRKREREIQCAWANASNSLSALPHWEIELTLWQGNVCLCDHPVPGATETDAISYWLHTEGQNPRDYKNIKAIEA